MAAADDDVSRGLPADIGDGDLYLPMSLGANLIPHRLARLQLRELTSAKEDAASAVMEKLGAILVAKKIQLYMTSKTQSQQHPRRTQIDQQQCVPGARPTPPQTAGSRSGRWLRSHPHSVLQFNRARRLDERLDDLHVTENDSSSSPRDIRKARDAWDGNVRCWAICSAIEQAKEVQKRAAEPSKLRYRRPANTIGTEANICPITSEGLWLFVNDVYTPSTAFDPDAVVGAAFGDALRQLPAVTADFGLLMETPPAEDIEKQLIRVNLGSRPASENEVAWRNNRHQYVDQAKRQLLFRANRVCLDLGETIIRVISSVQLFLGLAYLLRAAVGGQFREFVDHCPTRTEAAEPLRGDIATAEMEDILTHVSPQSSSGVHGGCAIYRFFGHKRLPIFHAVYSLGEKHNKIKQLWKVGAAQVIYKRGDRERPEYWRSIRLQPAIYK
ncbi:hypothetical protein F444_21074 [Phytophthora nicotianae P1976]|uniref:Uncharacterized protein n=1 Tax=Phytophthora nicotianae P1976 TaxID=1317066 RepID=A0A080Z2B3_PHYNI|nr:hypothetical protein F444_21074 [Phytophthora nicotianae P1976]